MWPFNLFFRSRDDKFVKSQAARPFKGADRVEHRTEKDAYGKPREWTVYGIACNNVSKAVVHWQGWEDAGWRLIPVKDLRPFRYPNMSRLVFKYVEDKTVHEIGESTPGVLCTVRYYRIDKEKDNGIMACIVLENGERMMVSTDHLYGVDDPQFF